MTAKESVPRFHISGPEEGSLHLHKETSLFIRILSDHLNKRTTARPSEDVDWNSLYRLAQDHQVAGLIYFQCKEFLPQEYLRPFEKRYSAELFYYSNRLKETERIRKAFREAGIQFYTVKGMDAARFYPLPPLRTMGDSDFIVSDLPAAIHVMRKLGFQGEQEEMYMSGPANGTDCLLSCTTS